MPIHSLINELTSLVKTERQCCDFFDLNLYIKDDGSVAWLTITGQQGVKDFITTELQM